MVQFQTVSIPKLFIAGFIPAFLIAGSLLIMNYILAKKNGYKGSSEGWSARHIWCEMYRGFWALMAPVVILGGIYSGFFTPDRGGHRRDLLHADRGRVHLP